MNNLETAKIIKGPSSESIKKCLWFFDPYAPAPRLTDLKIEVYDARPYDIGEVLRATCVIKGEAHGWEACITKEGMQVALHRVIDKLVKAENMINNSFKERK